ncbi:MAG: hypothetical protein VB140_01480 [Burkholderia sp.]
MRVNVNGSRSIYATTPLSQPRCDRLGVINFQVVENQKHLLAAHVFIDQLASRKRAGCRRSSRPRILSSTLGHGVFTVDVTDKPSRRLATRRSGVLPIGAA